MSDTKHFGRVIRERRIGKGWSLKKLAHICGMCEKSLELIELGDTDPKLSSVLKIALALELDLGELNVCIETFA